MKRYKNYTAKKLKLPKRILFFAVVALVIFVVTVIVGNNLKSKIDSIDKTTTDVVENTVANETTIAPSRGFAAEHDPALSNVKAGCLELSGLGAEDARSAVRAVRDGGSNGICFVVHSEEGRLNYASPKVEEQSGLTASESLVSFDALSSAVAQADSLGLSTTAVMRRTSTAYDKTVADELCAMGFDEIIIRGFEGYMTLDGTILEEILAFVNYLRAGNEGVRFSPCLNAEIYLSAQNGFYLEPLYAQCQFLTIDMSAVDSEGAGILCEKLSGSFSAFMLRALLSGENAESAVAIRDVLGAHEIGAYTYVSAPMKVVDTTDTETKK